MVGKVIVLVLLILVLSFGGIIWFDYLNVIDAKTVLAPIYRFIPFVPGEGRTQPRTADGEDINLDAERLAVRLLALELRSMEMDTHQQDLEKQYGQIVQMAQELEMRQQVLEDMEKFLTAQGQDAEDKDRNIEQGARNLTGMPPQNAVDILAVLDDQLAIDIIRKTE